MKDLTVFVLTHNRSELVLETIESILNQSCHDFKFVVSDNSSDTRTQDLLKHKGLLDKFEYRKREIEYNGLEHFNQCLAEVDTSYFILFHDDDIMLPNMVETLYKHICCDKYIAIGANAYVLKNHIFTKKKLLSIKKESMILNQKEIVKQYCTGHIVPFPSYIYNKKKMGNIKFSSDFGKYSDVLWISHLGELGDLLWLHDPLMYYRRHLNQDSQICDLLHKEKLFTYYKSILGDEDKFIKLYEVDFLYARITTTFKNYKTVLWKDFFKLFDKSKKMFIKAIIKFFLILFNK